MSKPEPYRIAVGTRFIDKTFATIDEAIAYMEKLKKGEVTPTFSSKKT